ncbi:uncharacterized protein LOC119100966 [Pollicipes pollicipes]|uniref:uncharacterized protein LOC119100966 n=1 Tax=Pollicipes pollicipes TaxID=41117 RepID=UPI001884A4DE|nr:uncharacterized protein LOC119100966 [Pollicipes pollicipes]
MARVGLDNFQRASYLYQLAWAALRAEPSRPAASRLYAHMLATFSQKAVLRLERRLKRTACRACHALLAPGVTCTVRTRSRPQRCQVWTCRACGQSRRFPCPRPAGGRRQSAAQQRAAGGAAQELARSAGQRLENGDRRRLDAEGVQTEDDHGRPTVRQPELEKARVSEEQLPEATGRNSALVPGH